jgi:hypothetical protein
VWECYRLKEPVAVPAGVACVSGGLVYMCFTSSSLRVSYCCDPGGSGRCMCRRFCITPSGHGLSPRYSVYPVGWVLMCHSYVLALMLAAL